MPNRHSSGRGWSSVSQARSAAAVRHDHIVTIYQVSEERGAPFLAMEFLEGESLEARLKREGRLPLEDVLRIGREMALGLEAAHQREQSPPPRDRI